MYTCEVFMILIRLIVSQLGFSIPGSRPIFSIPNTGIGDASIPGFRDYKNCKLHAEKLNFDAYFCQNFVEFVYFEMFVFSFVIFTIRTAKLANMHAVYLLRVLTINMDSKTNRCKNIAKYDV